VYIQAAVSKKKMDRSVQYEIHAYSAIQGCKYIQFIHVHTKRMIVIHSNSKT